MYGIPEHCQPLSPAEEQVLLAVWACRPPATRRDIGEKLAAKAGPGHGAQLLVSAGKKGWVKSGKDQNRNTYTPTVTRRAYGVAAMRERLDTVFGATSPRRPGPRQRERLRPERAGTGPIGAGSWARKSTLKRKNMICMTHTGKARAKTGTSPLRRACSVAFYRHFMLFLFVENTKMTASQPTKLERSFLLDESGKGLVVCRQRLFYL